MRSVIIMAVLMCGVSLMALDITTLDGKTYHNVQISSVTPAGFDISYTPSGGGIAIKNLLFKDLPEKIRKEYHYNPQKAAHFQSRVNYYQKQRQDKMIEQYEAKVKEEQAEERRREELNAVVMAGRRYVVFKAVMSYPNGTDGYIDSPQETCTTGQEGRIFLVAKCMPQGNQYEGYIYPINQTVALDNLKLSCYVTNLETAITLWNPKGTGSKQPAKTHHQYKRNYRDLYNVPAQVLNNYYNPGVRIRR